MSTRTFLALNVDDAVRRGVARLAQQIGDLADPDAKIHWVRQDNLHITLNFLGNVPDEILADVCNSAAEVAAEFEPFDFHIRNLAAVPADGRQLRVFWLDIEDPTGRLVELQRGLTDALVDLGMRPEARGYKPHLTLARVKYAPDADAIRQVVAGFASADFGTQYADEVVVYSSVNSREGMVYAPIASAPLGAE